MSDMLVRLYALPEPAPVLSRLRENGIEIRPVLAPETEIVTEWVSRHFSPMWASECRRGFANTPVSTLIALDGGRLVGFACYDATCRSFFGPTGVAESARHRGIGSGLLLAALQAMHTIGYAYAIIGGAGPVDFYAKAVGAIPIEGSSPGIYRGMLSELQP